MSTLRYSRDGLQISTYAGPADEVSPNTRSSTRIQLCVQNCFVVTLSMDEWVDLVCFIRSLDRRGLGILSAPEVA